MPPPPTFVPSSSSVTPLGQRPTHPTLPDPKYKQTNPPFKKPTHLKFADANFSPEELRAYDEKYYYDSAAAPGDGIASTGDDGPRGKKRARAEDFL